MPKKPSRPFRILPLQKVTAVPITDPARLAELEAIRSTPEEAVQPVRVRGGARKPEPVHAADVLALFQRLPEEEKPLLVEQLAAELPSAVRRRLAERWRK
jgi:hypothetical protein